MKVSINIAIYNEEKNISSLLESLLHQTKMPDEIIIVDDGSTDKTAEIIKNYAAKNLIIKYIYQKNSGPAAARNIAWKNSSSDICLFTDGDCVPENNWVEIMLKNFKDTKFEAIAGTYKTINKENILARFVGYEIMFKYINKKGPVDFHGTYNLAVKRKILEEINGFNTSLRTGEDADLTYRISKKYVIYFTPESIVGHFHPENIWNYLKSQIERGKDRVLLYKLHPDKISGDAYTSEIIKYQVLAGGMLMPSLILFYPFFSYSYVLPTAIIGFLFLVSLPCFIFIFKRDLLCSLVAIPIQIIRSVAWFIGFLIGLIKFRKNKICLI